ncbi:MAG: PQQ-binding-like beta-propeller repeat protein [Planctomycetota bacterium]|nr:PQQ-binding-like beta-propeller repeat protein [Planctomycetota bacterium]MDA1210950.1 PQQ-binding-like beta-propeller repeat protein [Planctomycetota bacterium]
MTNLLQRSILVAVVGIALQGSLVAQEWTRFRGPNGSGESETKTIPSTWTDDDYNWNIELPGVGNSSPVVWGDRLFILSADPQTAERYVLCYHADTGEKLWSRAFESTHHHIHAFSSFASSTPAVDEELVYVAWSSPESAVLKAFTHDGEPVWDKDLGPWHGQHGFGTSPVLYDDLVFVANFQELHDDERGTDAVPPPSFLLAFDRKTGDERWRIPRIKDNLAYAAPAIFQPEDGKAQLVNASTGSGMYAVDPFTGEELWSIPVFDKRAVSSPLVKGDLIFGSTGSGGGGNYLAAVRSNGKQAEMAYKIETAAPYVPTPVARDDMLFMLNDGGVVTLLDLPTGKEIWQKRIGGNYHGSPVRAADKFFCVSVEGDVVVLAAEREFEELGRMSLGEGSRSSPAIARGQLYIRTFSHLMSVGGK